MAAGIVKDKQPRRAGRQTPLFELRGIFKQPAVDVTGMAFRHRPALEQVLRQRQLGGQLTLPEQIEGKPYKQHRQ